MQVMFRTAGTASRTRAFSFLQKGPRLSRTSESGPEAPAHWDLFQEERTDPGYTSLKLELSERALKWSIYSSLEGPLK